jgi:hypothetical protein
LPSAPENAPRHWTAPNQLVLALIEITNNIPRVKTRGYYDFILAYWQASLRNL